MQVQHYRKKPIVIEAMQLNFDNLEEFEPWMDDQMDASGQWNDGTVYIEIRTLEGVMTATQGDYIIKGVKGEFYPCKPDIFEATYEKVEPNERK
jgi:hypothetical protein